MPSAPWAAGVGVWEVTSRGRGHGQGDRCRRVLILLTLTMPAAELSLKATAALSPAHGSSLALPHFFSYLLIACNPGYYPTRAGLLISGASGYLIAQWRNLPCGAHSR